MKLFEVTQYINSGDTTQSPIKSYYVTDDIRKVWAELKLDLVDEATSIVGIHELVPILKVIP